MNAEPITLAGLPGLFTPGRGERRRPPLLFIHGAFCGHEPFYNWMQACSEGGYDCYALSRRGRNGIGPERAAGVSMTDYLADTLAVVDALPAPPIVVGHSLGGLLAQQVAEAGRCAAAVLLAPAPPAKVFAPPVPRALPSFVRLMPSMFRGGPFKPPFGVANTIALNRLPQEQRRAVYDGFICESGRAFREMSFGVKVDAARITCPMLCVAGGHDRIEPPAVVRRIARRYGAEFRLEPEHGHFLIIEPGWERIAAATLAWLERLPLGVGQRTAVRAATG
jgi:pimeloyl-ACP methyl ester carboxylesterase